MALCSRIEKIKKKNSFNPTNILLGNHDITLPFENAKFCPYVSNLQSKLQTVSAWILRSTLLQRGIYIYMLQKHGILLNGVFLGSERREKGGEKEKRVFDIHIL